MATKAVAAYDLLLLHGHLTVRGAGYSSAWRHRPVGSYVLSMLLGWRPLLLCCVSSMHYRTGLGLPCCAYAEVLPPYVHQVEKFCYTIEGLKVLEKALRCVSSRGGLILCSITHCYTNNIQAEGKHLQANIQEFLTTSLPLHSTELFFRCFQRTSIRPNDLSISNNLSVSSYLRSTERHVSVPASPEVSFDEPNGVLRQTSVLRCSSPNTTIFRHLAELAGTDFIFADCPFGFGAAPNTGCTHCSSISAVMVLSAGSQP